MSEVHNQQMREEIMATIGEDWANQTEVLKSITGDATLKRKALAELVSENLVERRGTGKKNSPYEVRSDFPFAVSPYSAKQQTENWEDDQPTVWEV